MIRAAVITALLGIGAPAYAEKAFFEGFDSLPLGPNKEEAVAGTKVWTHTAPAGWVHDDSQMPGFGNPAQDGVTEWAGWSFADRDWWVRMAGDQRRSDFTFGTGTVMIADPDEWDDAAHAKGFFHAFITTPEIDVSAYAANSLVLAFDSSWRPEALDDAGGSWPSAEDGSAINNQTGIVQAAFDGGAANQVLRFESTRQLADGSDNPFFHEDKTKADANDPDEIANTNEPIIVPLNNPAGAKKLKVSFGMVDAANDWWWALDNVAVGVPPLVTGVRGSGVAIRARIAEALGKTVDDAKPITMELDGTAITPVTVSRDGSLVYVAYNQAPNIFTPGTKHQVNVKFTTGEGKSVTDGGEFTAPSYTSVAVTPAVLTATVTNPSYFTVDSSKGATLKLDGQPVTPTSVAPFTTDTTAGLIVRYGLPSALPPGSSHVLEVTYTTTDGKVVPDAVTFTAADYKTLVADLATAVGTAAEPGMLWRTHELATGRDNSIALVEQQLHGDLGPSIHDKTGENAQGYFEINWVNFEQDSKPAGIFTGEQSDETNVADDPIPGIPGTLPNGDPSNDNIGAEALTYIEFPTAGIYTMVVRSDDGFQVSAGIKSNPTYQILGAFDGGRGDAPTEFYVQAPKPGVYLFRLLWFEGGGGASVEWYTVNANGTKALVGGQQTGALKAYRKRTVAEPNPAATPAKIDGQPKGGEITEGDSIILSVSAIGDQPLNYLWSRNGKAIDTATKSTLPILKAKLADAGNYTVTVWNNSGTNNSLVAPVSVVARTRSKVLLTENFEELTLGPNVEEGITTGSGGAKDAVVTHTPPAGWTVDNSGMVGLGNSDTDGVVEWAGWSFANKDWWAATTGDQTRSQFKKAVGTVAIADGDEWDDLPRDKSGSMKTLLITKAIDVSGLKANSLLLKYDSSWRPESPQKAVVRVSFDGGADQEILRWTGDSADATFHPDAQSETISLPINNPAGAKTAKITWAYLDAGNNWWWALDNIEVSADPAGFDDLALGLATYLPFENDYNDASGHGVNGTPKGTPSFTAGKVGKAVNVRTVKDPAEFSYVSLGRQILFGTDTGFTIAFWAQVNSNTGDPSFVANKDWNGGSNVGFVIATDSDNRIQWNLNTDGGARKDFDSPGGVFDNNAWKHIVVTFDRHGPAETWVDGVRVNSKLIDANAGQLIDTPNLDLNIGQDGKGTYTDNGGVFHNANIDEVAIWKRVLSDTEIGTVYTRGAAGQPVISAATPPGVVVSTVIPAGLAGTPLTNVVLDEATKTITADLPAGGAQGYLTISPAQTIKSVQVVNGKLVIKY